MPLCRQIVKELKKISPSPSNFDETKYKYSFKYCEHISFKTQCLSQSSKHHFAVCLRNAVPGS